MEVSAYTVWDTAQVQSNKARVCLRQSINSDQLNKLRPRKVQTSSKDVRCQQPVIGAQTQCPLLHLAGREMAFWPSRWSCSKYTYSLLSFDNIHDVRANTPTNRVSLFDDSHAGDETVVYARPHTCTPVDADRHHHSFQHSTLLLAQCCSTKDDWIILATPRGSAETFLNTSVVHTINTNSQMFQKRTGGKRSSWKLNIFFGMTGCTMYQ